jgi:hypothetical protein
MTNVTPRIVIKRLAPAEIERLIARRDLLTNRRDGLTDSKEIAKIDRKLATVPEGVNNDVDLRLGRTCAKLPEQPDYGPASRAATIRARHGDMTGMYAPLQALMNAAAKANQGVIDDEMEAQHDDREDWRNCQKHDD